MEIPINVCSITIRRSKGTCSKTDIYEHLSVIPDTLLYGIYKILENEYNNRMLINIEETE